MDTLKKIGSKIKVILTQLIAFILSFFKTEDDGGRVLTNDDNIKTTKKPRDNKTTNDHTTLPDEADTKSDRHLTYKQSISSINKDMKEEIKSRVQAKEIYFSEIVIVNTILEILEEKNNFKFSELSNNKKEEIKQEVEKINSKITPSIKKEMLSNKIKTKEELKDNISKKITIYHYSFNPIKSILNEEEKTKPDITIEDRELNVKPINKKMNEHIITIAPSIEEESKKEEPEEKEKPKEQKEFITIKKEEKNILEETPVDEVYFMADILPDKKNNISFPSVIKIDTEKDLISETKKEVAEAIRIKSEKIPFLMVPNNKKKSSAKEKIKNAIIDPAILVAATPLKNIEDGDEINEKELINEDESKKTIIKFEEEISPEEAKIADIEYDKGMLEDIKKDIKRQQELNNAPTKEIDKKEKIIEKPLDIKQDIQEENDNLLKEIEKDKEEIISRLEKLEKEEIKEENKKKKDTIPKEESKEEKSIPITIIGKKATKDTNEIKDLHRNTETIIINANNEMKKEEIEDKDYDEYTKQIDDLLYDIEMYKIKNEDTITPSEREKLNQEKTKLKSLKNKIDNQKEKDIEKERKELEAEITENEINGIQEELKQIHLEHQEEANDKVIEKLTKMEEENDKKLAEIEQQLIKIKIKKAAKAAEIPSILALPFIRHKYFFYFTIGLFVNNHFNLLNAIFKRKTVKYEPIDLTEIKNGYDALDKAIDQTYENMVYLDYLENESLSKYPSLKDDEEFTKYITKLRTRLNTNYEKLQKKQKMINKYIKKVNKRNKVFKKYKLIKEEDNQ